MDRSAVDLLNSLPERQRFVRGLRTWIGLRQTGVQYERNARAAPDCANWSRQGPGGGSIGHLRHARKKQPLDRKAGTQIAQLAERIDSTQRVISYYETVADSAPGPIIVQLAQVLDVSADELLTLRPAAR